MVPCAWEFALAPAGGVGGYEAGRCGVHPGQEPLSPTAGGVERHLGSEGATDLVEPHDLHRARLG